tara:strand:+ start:1002 stop:1514 length:513 start_codon:yes stop_codon:yes gene_type:complete
LKRSEKENFVSSLNTDLNNSNLLVVVHNLGLKVTEMEDLRSKMRKEGVKFKVAKNRLAKLALPGTSFEDVKELFKGPTAIAFSEDSIKAAKIAVDFSKDNNKLKIVGGSFEGKLVDKEKINYLATLPSLDELKSQLISIINSPASKIVQTIQAPGGNLARIINAFGNKTA